MDMQILVRTAKEYTQENIKEQTPLGMEKEEGDGQKSIIKKIKKK